MEEVMETVQPAVSLDGMKRLARREFLKYQQAEGVVRATLFTIGVTAAFEFLIWAAENLLHAPRLQLIGIIGLALALVIGGLWMVTAERRALAKFTIDKSNLAGLLDMWV